MQHRRPGYRTQIDPRQLLASVRCGALACLLMPLLMAHGSAQEPKLSPPPPRPAAPSPAAPQEPTSKKVASEKLAPKKQPPKKPVKKQASPDESGRPHRLKYRSTAAPVDLGVGLWAWPLPMDWDNDGDLDLVVSCPDVPFRGTYLFENPGGTDKMPIFKPPVFLAPPLRNATLSYVDETVHVLVPGHELVDFRANQFGKQETIYPQTNVHDKSVRANQWRYVDYDGDSVLDIVVGVGDWTDYGWDDAYDAQGNWTRGPLHGYVYLLRNTGTSAAPTYAKPKKITAAGGPIDVYGMPSPNFNDFDDDGDLDLLCGEFLDGFTYFQNTGTRAEPRYAKGHKLTLAGAPLHMDLQMIVPVAIDWDADGDFDIVCGDEDGRVALLENTGKLVDHLPQFLAPKYFQQQADFLKFGALVTPVSVDWDGDGDEDLVCGNSAGYIAFVENLDGKSPPQWAPPVRLQAAGKTIRIQAGKNGSIQGPCEAKWGYTTLNVADWDHDGLHDLVINSIWGKVQWFRNIGKAGQPQLSAPQNVRVDWPAGAAIPKPAWNWWDPAAHELATQWRTTPVVIDLDEDGLNDLVMLDDEGYLAFYRRKRVDGQLCLEPGRRIFTDSMARPLRLNAAAGGRSGRRKFCFVDWDGDGRLDLLVNSRSINLLRNVSTDRRPWAFLDEGPIDQRRLAGHTTSPTIVDWNHDHKPDLLIGAEDGHFYYQPHNWQPSKQQETNDLTIETRHVTDGTLDNGERSFENRKYVWFDVPEDLRGWRFTRTSGGEPAFISVLAKHETVIFIAIARDHKGIDLSGWTLVKEKEFGYTDRNRARMDVFQRTLRANDRIAIPQGNWSGGLLLIPPQVERP